MASKEIVTEIPEWIRVFKDGTVERPRDFPIVPPTLNTGGGGGGLSSKDITISRNPPKPISARIYLPNITNSQTQKLPIYVYFHGGGFFFESAFSKLFNDHFLKLVPEAKVIVVSVEYRLAPEHPLPAAYDDCWDALKWVASHSTKDTTPNTTEPWLTEHGDFSRVFIGGDSAGANIVHNILAFRVGPEPLPGDVQILGSILVHPYFYGSKPVGSEPVTGLEQNFFNLVWKLVYPSAPGGIDNPFINPLSPGAPSLAELACSRMLVCVAENDGLRDRGVWYYEAVKKSGWKGEIQLFEDKDEDHDYHLLKPALNQDSHKADELIKLMASFLVN